jgi:hypothetical protein
MLLPLNSSWKSIHEGAIRVSTEEIDVLVQIYPQYALWLASGEVVQTHPEFDQPKISEGLISIA